MAVYRAPNVEPVAGRRVLLADADEDTRADYQVALSRAGFDIVEASDGRDALAKALIRAPAIVIADTQLPFIDGYALCDVLRTDRTTRSVPIVVVSEELGGSQSRRALSAGADLVLAKPCRLSTLMREVRRLVEEPRAWADGRAAPTTEKIRQQLESPSRARAALLSREAAGSRPSLVRAHPRFETSSPPSLPPVLTCPACDRTLMYQRSHIGGVSSRRSEQWDYYVCLSSCGTFQYRQRTRKLRRLE
jgi:CheY-like chemotaxis protein